MKGLQGKVFEAGLQGLKGVALSFKDLKGGFKGLKGGFKGFEGRAEGGFKGLKKRRGLKASARRGLEELEGLLKEGLKGLKLQLERLQVSNKGKASSPSREALKKASKGASKPSTPKDPLLKGS